MTSGVQIERMRYVMGTLLRVRGHAREASKGEARVDAMLALFQELEDRLSRFRTDSELSRINRAELEESRASAWTRNALETARALERRTQGLYAPRLHGHWDLGGCAKGFALDQALTLARSDDTMTAIHMDFGGQLLFWNADSSCHEDVFVEVPLHVYPAPLRIPVIPCYSVSTSAPFERGAHIVHPRTGQALNTARSVTVVAPSASDADAWSTALYISGFEAASRLLSSEEGITAYFLEGGALRIARGQAIRNPSATASCPTLSRL